ncbi:MAG: hypothetical protein II922_07600 [Succinimonas sp.]|nr:hypothetical protein [Succinimonas sp.]
MKTALSALLGLIVLSAPVLITGCGDPTLDLNGSKDEQKESILNVVNSYDTEDRIAFLTWYRGNESQNKIINGRKASEIIKIVRDDWKEAYVKRNLNPNKLNFTLSQVLKSKEKDSALCDASGTEIPMSDVEKERIARLKMEADLFNHITFSCEVNPANPASALLVTVKNDNTVPLSALSIHVDNTFIQEIEIAGGVAPGETKSLEVSTRAVQKVREGYECRPGMFTFYTPNDGKKIVLGVLYENGANGEFLLQDLPDFYKFYGEKTAYYEEQSGKNKACEVIKARVPKVIDDAVQKAQSLTGISAQEEK